MDSNPNLYDNERTGDDLLARIDELTEGVGGPGHGWRYLLLACAREIRRLNSTVQAGDTAISQLSQAVEVLERERDELRQLQDRWLALPVVKHQIRNHSAGERIAGPDSPTFADVRQVLLPDWREWFNDFFM